MAKPKTISYKQAGVSIDANDQMVDRIGKTVAATYGPRVIGLKNGFAGLLSLEFDPKRFKKNYRHPVLVACTDGVGTKVLIAQEMKQYDTIGIDLVAMNVNDMIVQGAEPLLFLDYLGVHKLTPAFIAELVASIAKGCKQAGCALIGGETAEMPDIYDKPGEYDMAGFAVGVVERNKVITGKDVKAGDVILGLASSGVHSNGYTLVRHVCFKKNKFKLSKQFKELGGRTLGQTLLEPTRIYVKPIVGLLQLCKGKQAVHAMAHITGGGLVGNIPRVLPDNCDAIIQKESWNVPAIFPFLQKHGPVDAYEMYRVFNMGIGYVVIVPPAFADKAQRHLELSGQTVYRIGHIAKGNRKVVLK